MARIIHIETINDVSVEPYRNIRERDLVGRQGRFVVEGEVVLRMLAHEGRWRCLSVLIDPKRLEKLQPILAALPEETPVYLASQAVLNGIVGFDIHRGVLALAERTREPTVDALLAGLGLITKPAVRVVVLFGIGNHDNMGGVFRNAAAFGADAVLLDAQCCDPLYRKAIRVSVGAVLRTPFARFAPQDDILAMLQAAGFEPLALSPAGGETLSALKAPHRAAILLGPEGPGLPAVILEQARNVRIPMAEGFDSLNVAMTSGLVLHHLAAFQ